MTMTRALLIGSLVLCLGAKGHQPWGAGQQGTGANTFAQLSVTGSGWQGYGATSSGATITVSPTNGNALLVAIGNYRTTSSVTSVVDNNSTALTKDAEFTSATSRITLWRLQSASSTTGITITLNTAEYWVACIVEVTGLAGSPVDVVAASANSNSWTTPSVTTTNANDILIAFGYNPSATTHTATSPAVMGNTYNAPGSHSTFLAYQIVSATGSYSLAGTGGADPNSLVAYKGQ